MAGTQGDYWTARYVLTRFRDAGLSASLYELPALMSYPESAPSLILRRPGHPDKAALLEEPEIPEDATSGRTDLGRLPYVGYSPSGTVEAELVYANYGVLAPKVDVGLANGR